MEDSRNIGGNMGTKKLIITSETPPSANSPETPIIITVRKKEETIREDDIQKQRNDDYVE